MVLTSAALAFCQTNWHPRFFMFLGRKLEPASTDGGASPSMRRA